MNTYFCDLCEIDVSKEDTDDHISMHEAEFMSVIDMDCSGQVKLGNE